MHPLGTSPPGLRPQPPRALPATPAVAPSLCPLCGPQVSSWHKMRLFHVLETVIGVSDSLEESWEKAFIKLALENMAKSTVGPPPQPPGCRQRPQGCKGAGTARPWAGQATPVRFPIFSPPAPPEGRAHAPTSQLRPVRPGELTVVRPQGL